MINTLPENYTIGVDCVFHNNSAVVEENWPKFERYKETIKMTRKPIVFSKAVIPQYFNDVLSLFGEVLRDSEFSFVKHMRDAGFKLEFDAARDSWIVNI